MISPEPRKIASNEYLSTSFCKKKETYDKILHHWYHITLPNGDKLCRQALHLMSIISYVKRTGRTVRYNYFMNRMEKSQAQVKRYFDKLIKAGICEINYVKSKVINGIIHRHVLDIDLTEKGYKELKINSTVSAQISSAQMQGSNPSTLYIYKKEKKEIKNIDLDNIDVVNIDIKTPEENFPLESESTFSQKYTKLSPEAESTFFQAEEVQEEETEFGITTTETPSNQMPTHPSDIMVPIKLEYMPLLSEEEGSEIQRRSGREFTLNYMNQLLMKLKSRNPQNEFPNRRIFMNYFTKVIKNEKRDSYTVSSTNFRLKCNLTEKDLEMNMMEKYLADVERYRPGMDNHLKRKLAAVLEPVFAYELLTNLKQIREPEIPAVTEFEQLTDKHKICTFCFSKRLEISEGIRTLLLNQVKAVYGPKVEKLVFIVRNSSPKPWQKTVDTPQPKVEQPVEEPSEMLWPQVRQDLKAQYGEGVDRAWISKLIAEEDSETKVVKLTGSTPFISSWIKSNYFWNLVEAYEKRGFKLWEIHSPAGRI